MLRNRIVNGQKASDATYEAHTTFGVIGVKVWICKGEILNKRSVTCDNTSDNGGEALC